MLASPPHEPVIRSQRGARLVSSYRMTKRALPSGNPRREGVLLTTRTDYETHTYLFRKRFDTTAALRGVPRLHGRFAAGWFHKRHHGTWRKVKSWAMSRDSRHGLGCYTYCQTKGVSELTFHALRSNPRPRMASLLARGYKAFVVSDDQPAGRMCGRAQRV